MARHCNPRPCLERWLDLFAPCHCVLCGMRSRRPLCLCLACESELPANRPACPGCALPLPELGSVCGHCQRHPPAYNSVLAPYLYTAPVAGFIQALKFNRDISMLPVLTQLLVAAIRQRLLTSPPPDLLIPMPLHWSRRLRRGFNQAELLARSICGHPQLRPWHLQVNSRLCQRQRATRPQLGLDSAARAQNLRHSMSCAAASGLRLAVVDDVLTTGASANEVATVLLAAGAQQVEIWCCARTPAPRAGSAMPG
jgi:ComF family protein